MSRLITTIASFPLLFAGCTDPAPQPENTQPTAPQTAAHQQEDRVLAAQVAFLAEHVAALELQTAELQGLAEIYNDPSGPGANAEDPLVVERDPLVQNRANQLLLTEQQYRVLREKHGPEHEKVKDLHIQRDVMQGQLDKLRAEVLTRIQDHRREQARSAYLNSKHALLLAREKLAETQAALSSD